MSKLRGLLTALMVVEFSGKVNYTTDSNGGMIAIVTLDNPIEEVLGSQTIEFENQRFPLKANDVEVVKIHEDEFDELDESITVNEANGTLSYKGSKAILDVAKSDKGVWLKRQSFANQGNAYRGQLQRERAGKLLNMAVTQPVTGGTPAPNAGTPEPVTGAKAKATI